MIIKICEEMRQVRLNLDYENYRTLVNILKEYVSSDIFSIVYNSPGNINNKEIKENAKVLFKWVDSEIDYVKELLNINLEKKNYKNFKMLSQSDIVLRGIHNRIKELRLS